MQSAVETNDGVTLFLDLSSQEEMCDLHHNHKGLISSTHSQRGHCFLDIRALMSRVPIKEPWMLGRESRQDRGRA